MKYFTLVSWYDDELRPPQRRSAVLEIESLPKGVRRVAVKIAGIRQHLAGCDAGTKLALETGSDRLRQRNDAFLGRRSTTFRLPYIIYPNLAMRSLRLRWSCDKTWCPVGDV